MRSVFSGRFIAVVRASLVDQANQVMRNIDRDGGDQTFTIPLVLPNKTVPVAYWASLVVTPEQSAFLDSKVREATAAKAIVEPGEAIPALAQVKVLLFRADEGLDNAWTPETVLAALGVERLQTSTP